MNKITQMMALICSVPAILAGSILYQGNEAAISRGIEIGTGLLFAALIAIVVSIINVHKADKEEDFENFEATLLALVFSVVAIGFSLIMEIVGAHLTSSWGPWVRIVVITILMAFGCYAAHLYIVGHGLRENLIDQMVSREIECREASIKSAAEMEMSHNYEEEISKLKSDLKASEYENKNLTSIIESGTQEEIIRELAKLKSSVDFIADNEKYKRV